ncbi:urease accessory protein UreE [Polymorphobacter glacialis]|uniref:Urease accessory protein UreE n=1 Tax=Sandarakinorhabdus glacialis TaxID=1614636 RepID=A0A917E6B2_9SPHN|nr:urease accessory protein UreE [Polymorphobacter glacialis]GGE07312.1 urease accessory protein UreE [Polymorphobacter glacialis]
MQRATTIIPAGQWNRADAIDSVSLDHAGRHRRRFHFHGASGAGFLLDLPRAVVLADGDGLRLEDGRIIAVAAAPEALLEVTATDPAALLAIAWHIGNRHLPAELRGAAIRLRADYVIAEMLRGLGGTVTAFEAPFNPEQGAYAGGHGDHHSHHGDNHDHHHDH